MNMQNQAYFAQLERLVYEHGRVAWLGCRYIQHINRHKTAPKSKSRGGYSKRKMPNKI